MSTIPVESAERRALCTDHATRLGMIEHDMAAVKEELKPIRGIRNLLVVISMLLAVVVFIYLEDREASKTMHRLLIDHSLIMERLKTKLETIERKPGWQVPG